MFFKKEYPKLLFPKAFETSTSSFQLFFFFLRREFDLKPRSYILKVFFFINKSFYKKLYFVRKENVTGSKMKEIEINLYKEKIICIEFQKQKCHE